MLPQLQHEDGLQRVPAPIVEERLLKALASSTWAAAALRSWQCRGGGCPLRLPRGSHCSTAPGARLLQWRHNRLAAVHRALMKVSSWQARSAQPQIQR